MFQQYFLRPVIFRRNPSAPNRSPPQMADRDFAKRSRLFTDAPAFPCGGSFVGAYCVLEPEQGILIHARENIPSDNPGDLRSLITASTIAKMYSATPASKDVWHAML
jgi:hypothetical protein